MPSAGFEPAIPTTGRSQTDAFDCAAAGMVRKDNWCILNPKKFGIKSDSALSMQTLGDVQETKENLEDDSQCLDRDCNRALHQTATCYA